jgi:hypothetical protein
LDAECGHGHQPPGPGCHCGVYGYYDQLDAICHGHYRHLLMSHGLGRHPAVPRHADLVMVLGMAHFGAAVKLDDASAIRELPELRARYCVIKALYMPQVWTAEAHDHDSVRRQLAERYRVPVLNGFPRNRLPDGQIRKGLAAVERVVDDMARTGQF